MVMPNGSIRNTAVYSITKDEWPALALSLSERIETFITK
jgi:hypothetical protein